MKKKKGFVYIKHILIGTRSEALVYVLQTKDAEYALIFDERRYLQPDYYIEFFNRKMVEITAKSIDETKKEIIVKSIVFIPDVNIP